VGWLWRGRRDGAVGFVSARQARLARLTLRPAVILTSRPPISICPNTIKLPNFLCRISHRTLSEYQIPFHLPCPGRGASVSRRHFTDSLAFEGQSIFNPTPRQNARFLGKKTFDQDLFLQSPILRYSHGSFCEAKDIQRYPLLRHAPAYRVVSVSME
jgi:hypothetical protein